MPWDFDEADGDRSPPVLYVCTKKAPWCPALGHAFHPDSTLIENPEPGWEARHCPNCGETWTGPTEELVRSLGAATTELESPRAASKES